MRARNLKPGFFSNEDLARLPMAARILFQGLWCMADREGRLEDRPGKIKGEIFPHDDVDVVDLLAELAALADYEGQPAAILRYEVAGRRYIQVVNFTKHQSPHVKERPSELPAPDSHHASTRQASDKPASSTESGGVPAPPDSGLRTPDVLTPDSGLLTADSGLLAPQGRAPAREIHPAPKPEPVRDELFEAVAAAWKGGPYEAIKGSITEPQRELIGMAAGKLRAVQADPADVLGEWQRINALYDRPTPAALVKHWSANGSQTAAVAARASPGIEDIKNPILRSIARSQTGAHRDGADDVRRDDRHAGSLAAEPAGLGPGGGPDAADLLESPRQPP